MGNEVKWIKLDTGMFDDEKIKLISTMPKAHDTLVIWFKILCLAGKCNNSGLLTMGNNISYTEKMLANLFNEKESVVISAIDTLLSFGLLEKEEGVLLLPNWEKHQRLDALEKKTEYMKEYMKEYREKQKTLASQVSCKTNCKTNSKANCKANVSSLESSVSVSLSNSSNTLKEFNSSNININNQSKENKQTKEDGLFAPDFTSKIEEQRDSLIEDELEIIQYFSTLPHKNKLTSLSDLRKRNLKKAIKQFSKEKLLEAMDIMRENEPLCQKSWSNFDWFLRENSVNGLLDNTYEWMKNEKQDKYSALPKLKYLPEDYDSNDPDVHEY